jgi:hypothetical protein
MLHRIIDLASARSGSAITAQFRAEFQQMLQSFKDVQLFDPKTPPSVVAQYERIARDLVAALNCNAAAGNYLALDNEPSTPVPKADNPSHNITSTEAAIPTNIVSIASIVIASRAQTTSTAAASAAVATATATATATTTAAPIAATGSTQGQSIEGTITGALAEDEAGEDAQELLDRTLGILDTKQQQFIPIASVEDVEDSEHTDAPTVGDEDTRYYSSLAQQFGSYEKLVRASPNDVSLWLNYALEVCTRAVDIRLCLIERLVDAIGLLRFG